MTSKILFLIMGMGITFTTTTTTLYDKMLMSSITESRTQTVRWKIRMGKFYGDLGRNLTLWPTKINHKPKNPNQKCEQVKIPIRTKGKNWLKN